MRAGHKAGWGERRYKHVDEVAVSRGRTVGLGVYAAVVVVAVVVFHQPFWRSLVGIGATAVIFRIGYAMVSGLAQPVPEPPEAGELRKVKLTYRCSICGAEVRMTVAAEQDPAPPRHCMEDMDLITSIE